MIINDLFVMGVPIAEKVIRTVAVYGAILVLLRIAGRRDLAQLSTFDLVVVLLLSNVVQNAIIGPDNSLSGGLLGAAVLIGVNALWSRIVQSRPRLLAVVEGSPVTLVSDGRFVDRALTRQGIRRADLDRALHLQGADGVQEVAQATLNSGGAIVVELREADQNASRGDLDQLRRHLDEALSRIEARLPHSDGMSNQSTR
ncbi:MAG TPA: YetF domain-containing protein [Mycobacteriales bacterium]|nr:YetF domain-containing protein [Mycobacteriales bacterium]